MSQSLLLSILQIFGFLVIGVVVRILGYIKSEEVDRWSAFTIDILFTITVFSSMIEGLDAGRLRELWVLPVIGFWLATAGWIAGFGLKCCLKHRDMDTAKTFHYLCAINNSAYLPVIILASVFGKEAVANLFLLNVGSTVAIWTIGVGLLKGLDIKESLRKMLTPNLIALIAGMVIVVAGIQVYIPSVVRGVLADAGAITIPLILIIIGATIWGTPVLRYGRDTALAIVARLVIVPILSMLPLMALRLPHDVFVVSLVVALMPAPAIAPLFTRRFGGNTDFAAAVSVATTAISLVTVPALFCLFSG